MSELTHNVALDREWLEDWTADYERVCNGLARLAVVETTSRGQAVAREQHRVRLLESRLLLVRERLGKVSA